MAPTRTSTHLTPPASTTPSTSTPTPLPQRPAGLRGHRFRCPGTRATGDAVASNAPPSEWLTPTPAQMASAPTPNRQAKKHTTEVNDHDPATRRHRRISLQPTSRTRALSHPPRFRHHAMRPALLRLAHPPAQPTWPTPTILLPSLSRRRTSTPQLLTKRANKLEPQAAVLEQAARRREGGPHTNPG